MSKLLNSVVAAALLFSTTVVASPYKDISTSHWSRRSIDKLASKGIIQGYPDGTFKGNQVVDRFSLAMVVAKTLASVEQIMEHGDKNLVSKEDLKAIDKLTTEFADELAMLGVKVVSVEEDMVIVKEDVAVMKRDVEGIKDYIAKGGMEKVKLSGDMLVRHTSLIHRNDWGVNSLTGAARAGSSDNSFTESLMGLTFSANIDENITAKAYWALLNYHAAGVNNGQSANQGSFGLGGIGAQKVTDSNIFVAQMEIKDMFRFGGDFIFGRDFFAHGHSLVLSSYVDVVRYTRNIGSIKTTLQTVFDRHLGSYKDSGPVDSRGIWNLDLQTSRCNHDFYLGMYTQHEPNLAARGVFGPLNIVAAPTPFITTNGAVANSASPLAAGTQASDKRYDVEFGSKGPIGKSSHWSYDLGFVYTDYQLDIANTSADTIAAGGAWISPELKSWAGHGAVKYDSKKQWAAKLALTFADDESIGAISLNNDARYESVTETPYEDIAKGNNWFNNGLINMYIIKLQTEYRPENSRHYFRLAGDFIDEVKSSPVNDYNRHMAGAGRSNAVITPAGGSKTNTVYDCWNNIGISDPKAAVVTFEYRYQLAENTRLRVGYTQFNFAGDARQPSWTAGASTPGTAGIGAGRGLNNDFDYNMFWSEIYSTF